MQRVLVALMLGAAAAFQRTPVVRSRVLAVFIQLHSPGRCSSRATRRSSPALAARAQIARASCCEHCSHAAAEERHTVAWLRHLSGERLTSRCAEGHEHEARRREARE